MLALSIRQPFAEVILRGIKTVEYRSRPTRIVGQRFWIYASKGGSQKPGATSQKEIWSTDLAMPGPGGVPEWMIELAEQVKMIPERVQGGLPRGVIVGSAVVERVEEIADCRLPIAESNSSRKLEIGNRKSFYRWHPAEVERAKNPRKPARQPQPVWFRPF